MIRDEGDRGDGPRRVRASRACDACAKRKSRCDNAQPRCSPCILANEECVYARTTRKRGPPKGRPSALLTRIRQLEEMLQKGGTDRPEPYPRQSAVARRPSAPVADLAALSGMLAQDPAVFRLPRQAAPAPQQTSGDFELFSMQRPSGGAAAPALSYSFSGTLGTLGVPAMSATSAAPAVIIDPLNPQAAMPVTVPGASFEFLSEQVLRSFGTGPLLPFPTSAALDLDGGMSYFLDPVDGGGPGSDRASSFGADPDVSLAGTYTFDGSDAEPLSAASPPLRVGTGGSESGASGDQVGPEAAMEDIVYNTYWTSPGFLWFPILHPASFKAKPLAEHDRFLLYAMCCLACRFSKHPAIDPAAAPDYFYQKAKALLYPTLESGGSLSTVQGLIHMILHLVVTVAPRSQEWLQAGIMIRVAQDIKLNLDPDSEEFKATLGPDDPPMTWAEKEERRRAWWTAYILDREGAVASDRSCMIQDEECRVSMPCDQQIFEFTDEAGPRPGLFQIEPYPAILVDADLTKLNTPAEVALEWMGLTRAQRLSPTGKIAFPANLDPFGYCCVLFQAFARVLSFHQRCALKGISPFSAECAAELKALEEAIEDWWQAVPPEMKSSEVQAPETLQFTRIFFPKIHFGRDVSSIFDVMMSTFYHTVQIVLHRPRVLSSMARDVDWIASPHFLTCVEHADSVLRLADLFVSRSRAPWEDGPEQLAQITPWMFFQAGLVQLLSLRNCDHTSTDPNVRGIIDRARLGVRTLVAVLEEMGVTWLHAKMVAKLLRQLAGELAGYGYEEATAEELERLKENAVGLGVGREVVAEFEKRDGQ
ncbi:fungal-specific transcription factor domain-containing protein [Hyaloraphidium curvatum]|nr:fungal-specific transcription factor domain-containing protein [Hyaloraphidium curvatum]